MVGQVQPVHNSRLWLKNTIRLSADALIVSADAIRKTADTIKIFFTTIP